MSGEIDPLYMAARRALLDVLDALGEHRESLVLVGAQAIYVHVGEADFAVSPYTTDADLAIDPRGIQAIPQLEAALQGAGFALHRVPGSWISASQVLIDLMVPELLAGKGSRSADLGVHGSRVARRARGLEAALVDYSARELPALDPADERKVMVKVAGSGALLVAKLIKIGERIEDPKRTKAKDALDVLRLLRLPSVDLAASLRRLRSDPLAGAVTTEALELLHQLFVLPEGRGSQLAADALDPLEDRELIIGSCVALSAEVLSLV